jgi:hypothetical protein
VSKIKAVLRKGIPDGFIRGQALGAKSFLERADRVGVNHGNTLHSRFGTRNRWAQARLPWSIRKEKNNEV